eukprot:CAMPEP_0202070770 /NCGR_PEP_ID=MMETSP0964-20121228/1381_1 /ASSEMBLY_ACC=CAM_ASM_000500 /TAXON_ID=4773 /ORGANISM="Schizochytrium aggregatum, Strain ATCC28209" /LENGTH=280 /DNA_ID=CAMNT_0048637677 /DNA_START=376 /DNA_END=1215 /DNA_ORIENTATION=-
MSHPSQAFDPRTEPRVEAPPKPERAIASQGDEDCVHSGAELDILYRRRRDSGLVALVPLVAKLAGELIGPSGGQADVDREEVVVLGSDHHGVPRPDEAGRAECGLLHQTELVDWAVKVQNVGHAEHPLKAGRPKVDGEGPRGVVQDVLHGLGKADLGHGLLDGAAGGAEAEAGEDGGAERHRGEVAGDLLALRLALLLVLVAALELVELGAHVEGVAREQQIVAGLDPPGEEHEKARVDSERAGHRQRDDLRALHGHVVGRRAHEAPVGHRAPKVRGLPS